MIHQTSSPKEQTEEPVVLHPLSKRMSLLSKIALGLCRSHPEYQWESRQQLGLLLRRVILQVYLLEREHDAKLITLDVLRECALRLLEIHQHAAQTQQPINPAEIYELVLEMLDTLEPTHDEQVAT